MRFLATCCKTARGMPTYGSGCMYAHVLCIVCTRIHVCVVWILIVKNVVPIYMCECICTNCRSYKPTKYSMWHCVSVYVHTYKSRYGMYCQSFEG